jgi:hypothetical protein
VKAPEWHYSKGGQQHGPVSAADLKALAKSGELSPYDFRPMIWKEVMAEWKPAGSLKGLFPVTTSTSPQKAPPGKLRPFYLENCSPHLPVQHCERGWGKGPKKIF